MILLTRLLNFYKTRLTKSQKDAFKTHKTIQKTDKDHANKMIPCRAKNYF